MPNISEQSVPNNLVYTLKSYDISRTCNLCGEKMMGGVPGFIQHGKEKHPDFFLQGSEKSARWEFAEKKYWFPITEEWYASRKYLARAISRADLSNEEYYLRYGEQYMPEEWKENNFDSKFGNAYSTPTCLECGGETKFNQMKWHYPAFCGFSCSTSWHAKNTDRVKRATDTRSEKDALDPTYWLLPNQVAYWIAQGLSETEAKEKVKERQNTGSLSRYIERYGNVKGRIKHAERQKKWLKSLNDSGMKIGYSEVSNKLFQKLSESFPNIKYGKSEISLLLKNRVVKVDCHDSTTRHIIEFYGDYWHANPAVYDTDAFLNKVTGKTGQEIHQKDRDRLKLLKDHGYKVLIVWEKDFADDPEMIINKCINFLSD